MMASSESFSQEVIGKKFSKTYQSSASIDYFGNDPPSSAINSITKNEDMDVEVPPADVANDIMGHDVNLCDICGDAGREDLLAVCSRCNDGAEHTYCMQTRLDKVPEGEWLCEECKSMDWVEYERQEATHKLNENEKGNLSAQASSEQVNSSDFERNNAKGEISHIGKRYRDDAGSDDPSPAKKPATVQTIGSPKTKDPGKEAPSSPDNCIKNHENGRLKFLHLSSSNASQVNDIPECTNPGSDLQSHGCNQGSLSKSTSFNSMASKRKVKLLDQAVLQRQKSVKEHASFRAKDGITRSMGKSMSFRTGMSSRFESKSKTLSPRKPHLLGNRNLKERSSYEQRSFISEQPLANSTMDPSKNTTSTIDKPAASRGESLALPRSSSFVGRRSIESAASLGEVKKPSISSGSTNGFNKIGTKSSYTGHKEDMSSCSVDEQRHYSNSDGAHHMSNSVEKKREQLGPSHSTRDELKKPGLHWKHKVSDQANDRAVSTGLAEVVSDHILRSNGTRRLVSAVMNPGENKLSVNFTGNNRKRETISNLKKPTLLNSKSSLSGGDGFSLVSSSTDVLNNVSVTAPLFLNSAAIPEHDYKWQGSFEINRSDRSFELWDGIQAHLSSCASPRVVHAVEKFESRIVLYEVPRISIWPRQFQDNGVKEEHIALFFFAKDTESYNKNYKNLVGKMMTNDLALRGDVHGVELLIFPSNQLHDNMKRWNSLFYIWGVFRGKRENRSDVHNSLTQSTAAQDISQAVVPLPASRCSIVPTASELPASVSEESHNLLVSRTVDEDCRANTSTLDESDSSANIPSSSEIQNNHQERDINPSCEPPFRDMTSSGCQMEKIAMDIPIDQLKTVSGANSVASDGISGNGIVVDRVCSKEQSSTIIEEKDSSKDGETTKRRKIELKDLNMMPEEWDLNQLSLTNGEACNDEPSGGALETMSHSPSVSLDFFPIESNPANDTPLLQDQIQDKSPNLELALWAENKTSTTEIGEKISVVDDDVSASLSLSLSFPFFNRTLSSKD